MIFFFLLAGRISVFFFPFPFCFEGKVPRYKEIGHCIINWLGTEVYCYCEGKIEAQLPSRG